MAEQDLYVYVYYIFIQSCTGGHFGCSHGLAIVSNASMIIEVKSSYSSTPSKHSPILFFEKILFIYF